ncbi:MAG: tyrosine-protein phosphatase [Myxococcales bacterium]|nr:tyrosine-protein phosphatase [Myxococcales bacterium]
MSTLRSVANFRDIGGHETASGRIVQRGRVFRSGHLANISEADLQRLDELGIRCVIDLRTGSDAALDGGSPLPRGARRVQLPMGDPASAPMDIREMLTGNDPAAVEHHLSDGQATRLMLDAAQALVVEHCKAYGLMLQELASQDGLPALVHCSAGKDRTGWAASLLLAVAGVCDEAIIDHYVESNRHRVVENARALEALPAGIDPEWMRPFYECRPAYARASLAIMRERWGDVDRYVVEGLRVPARDLETLRERLLT